MGWNPANALTFSRLILVPVFVACFIAEMKAWAFVIFCVAGFTDLIDGTVARFFGKPSKIGALLDPIADKLLMQSCFIALLVSGFLPLWFFAMALVRDAMIVAGIIYLELKKAKLPYRAIWPSKIATLFQMMVAGFGLLRWLLPGGSSAAASVELWQMSMMVAAAILIVVSGIQYVQMGFELLRQRGGEGAANS